MHDHVDKSFCVFYYILEKVLAMVNKVQCKINKRDDRSLGLLMLECKKGFSGIRFSIVINSKKKVFDMVSL